MGYYNELSMTPRTTDDDWYDRMDGLIVRDMVRSAFACIGCGDALPAGRGGHCQACVEWADPDEEDIDPYDVQGSDFEEPAIDDDEEFGQVDPDTPDPSPPPWEGPNAGRAIARHWHTRPQHFYAALAQFDRSIWPILAIPCAVYHGWTVRRMLDTWTKGVDRDIQLPASARP